MQGLKFRVSCQFSFYFLNGHKAAISFTQPFVYPHRRMHSAAALQPYIRLHIFPAASKGQLQGEFLNKAWFLLLENASSVEIQWDLSTPSWGL